MNRGDILKYIETVSPHYTPEWRLDADRPDMGSAFALTFADMFAETYSKYRRLAEKHHIEFINAAGIEPSQKQAANGYVCFSLAHGAPEGCLVDRDTPVYGDGDIVFTTTRKTYVTPSKLLDVYYRVGDGFYRAGGGDGQFTLFGKAESLQRHDWYIGHDWLFEHSQKAEIRLTAQGGSIHLLADSAVVSWQYFTGEWTDFPRVGYEGGEIVLSVERPFVKTEIHGTESFFIRCRALNPDAAEITLSGISVRTRSVGPVERKIYQDGIEVLEDGFYPFGKSLVSFSGCYIASGEAFAKRGAEIKISFDLALVRQEIQNPAPEVPVQWKRVMRKKELEPPPVYETEIDRVILEYWNGRDFVALHAEEPVKPLFSAGWTRKTLVFKCPDDMPPMAMFGLESRWIRFRILSVVNEYTLNSRHITPYISDLEIVYDYGDSLQPDAMFAENSGELRHNLPLKPFSFLPEGECVVYFGFDKPFGGSPVGFLWDTEPYGTSYEMRWHIFLGGEWKPIVVRGDFWRTGYSEHHTEEPMEPCVCFGQERYWMMAVIWDKPKSGLTIRAVRSGAAPVVQKTEEQTVYLDIGAKDTTKMFYADTDRMCDLGVFADECDELGVQSFVKWREDDENSYKILKDGIFFDEAALRRIYRHKDTPAIKIVFRMTEGDRGNAVSITRMGRSVGYIISAANPLPISGGRGIEPAERILERGGGKLAGRNRAVTARAYESLALEASVDVVKCKCIAGVDKYGEKLDGAVTVVYLPKDFDSNARRSAEIRSYIAHRSPPQAKIFVRETIFVEMSVTARITIKGSYVIKAREAVEIGLTEFLHPLKGNYNKKGFQIGEIPDNGHLLNYLYSVDGVEYVDGFGVTCVSVADNVRREIDSDAFPGIIFCVPVSGRHNIKVVSDDSQLKS